MLSQADIIESYARELVRQAWWSSLRELRGKKFGRKRAAHQAKNQQKLLETLLKI